MLTASWAVRLMLGHFGDNSNGKYISHARLQQARCIAWHVYCSKYRCSSTIFTNSAVTSQFCCCYNIVK